MNYGYGGAFNPYQRQQNQFMVPQSPMIRPAGGAIRDYMNYQNQQDAFAAKVGDMRGQGMSEADIQKYSEANQPGFMSNPRGYLMDQAGQGISAGASSAWNFAKTL